MTSRLRRGWLGIGGEEFLKPLYYYPALVPLLIGGIRFSEAKQQNWEVVLGYFVANLVGLAICATAAYLLLRYKRSRNIRLSAWSVVGIAIAIGVLKAIVTALILAILQIEPDMLAGIMVRLPGAVTASLVTIVFISFFGSMRLIYSAEREKLLLSRVSREQPGLTRSVFNQLDEVVKSLKMGVEDSLAPSQSSELVQGLLEQKIRPMSHELWLRESRRLQSFDLKELLTQTIFEKPYPALLIALVLPVVTPIWPAIIDGRWFEVFEEGLQVSAIALGLTILNFSKPRLSRRSLVLLTLMTLLLTSFVAGYLIPVVTQVESPATAVLSAIFLAAFLPNIAIVFGFGRTFLAASKNQEKSIKAELDSLGNSSAQQLQDMLVGREIAAALHGKIQNRLLLSMSKLDKGQTTLAMEVGEIERSVERLKSTVADVADLDLADLTAEFSPLVKVELETDLPTISRIQYRILEEAISNAYRHGKARNVQVKISSDGQVLEVHDDGLGPSIGTKGLGSYIFDSMGSWSLNALPDGGSKFKIHLNHAE